MLYWQAWIRVLLAELDVSRAERQRDTDTETMDELREQLRLKSCDLTGMLTDLTGTGMA